MSYTTVRAHTRNGHQVRAHSRRTDGSAVADVLRDLDRVYERIDREFEEQAASLPSPNSTCPHPAWYPVPHVDGTRILAYACTDCAASRSA